MKLTEDEIRRITLAAISELGEKASPELVKQVVQKAVTKAEDDIQTGESRSNGAGRIIITSFGINHPGVVSRITSALSQADCDIQDISQKIMQEFYTMIMLVDITNASKDLKELQEEMNQIASELNIKIFLQHEDLFRFMHRI
ncbi:MAG: ACT domain-containing protein [Bacteroidota bacterium]